MMHQGQFGNMKRRSGRRIFGLGLQRGLTSIFVLALVFSIAHGVHAASLSFMPNSTKVLVGNIVSVKVVVDTQGKSINNVESQIQYPTDMLEIMSMSKNSSIFSLWVEEPKFSNSAGTASMNGGLPNPGYAGSYGEVVSIVFRAKKQGTATLIFGDSAVRQNDGLGTDILSAKNSATIEIKPNENAEVAPPSVPSGTPDAPVVISSTHPESGKWYNNPNVDLRWEVPSDVSAASTLVSSNPNSIPTVTYSPPIANKKLANLEDGTWYFHVRLKNKNGWGAVRHFKIQIDTVPPNPFKITFPHGSTSDEPRPVSYFNTTDSLSGVNYYEVKIGEGQFMRLTTQEVASNPYTPPTQDPGTHPMLVKAVDMAGNETVQTAEFVVTPLDPPQLQDMPSEIDYGDPIRLRGTSYPLIEVEIVVADAENVRTTQVVNTLSNGEFAMTWPKKLNSGSYSVTLRAVDSRGAKSEYTKPVTFTVKDSKFSTVGALVLNWLSVIILLILVIGCIVLLIIFFIYRARKIRRSLRHKVRVTESSLSKAFDLLRENVRDQIKTLEKAQGKRELTKEEEKIIKHLQENLTKSEAYLEKELEDIENTASK